MNNMITGFTCGVFDLFHAGHVRMLKECKEHCDYLVVALNKAENLSPDKNIPVYSIEERVEILLSCKYVDEVLTYNSEEELVQLLKTKKYQVRFLGEDYKNKPITGAELTPEIYYTKRGHGLSTRGYLKKIIEEYKNKPVK